MSFLTFNQLTQKTFEKAETVNETRLFSKQKHSTIFLSYRRKDKNWVKPIIDFLRSKGANIYVDYIDDSLPDTPTTETAQILRKRIQEAGKFIVLATPNSSESKWIPWELGLGDGFAGYKNALILPLVDYNHTWNEQEYYRIYGYIKKTNSKQDSTYWDWAIFYPNGEAIWLSDWLTN